MDANAEIQALATRISNQRAEIERLTAVRHAQEEWLKEWRGRVIRAVNENANLTAELEKARAEIERLHAEIRELRSSDG